MKRCDHRTPVCGHIVFPFYLSNVLYKIDPHYVLTSARCDVPMSATSELPGGGIRDEPTLIGRLLLSKKTPSTSEEPSEPFLVIVLPHQPTPLSFVADRELLINLTTTTTDSWYVTSVK